MFNLRNLECQSKFRDITNNTKILSNSIRDSENIEASFYRFLKNLEKVFSQRFRKVRITSGEQKDVIEELLEERRKLKTKDDPISMKKLEEIEKELVNLTARKNSEMIEEELSKLKHGDGDVNMGSFWKLKQRLFPKARDVNVAKLDSKGHLVSSGGKLKNLYLNTYKERLKHRKIKPGLKEYQEKRESLSDLHRSEVKANIKEPWTMEKY